MISIRKASINDVDAIITIHCDAFANFFLTNLGTNFLYFYYSCFIESNEGLVVCVEEDGKIIGFAAATKRCKGFNASLIKNNIYRFIGLSLKLSLSNPKALIRLIRNLTKTNNNVLDRGEYAELYSIAVKKEEQGRGLGKRLLLAAEEMLKVDNVNQLSLTTDYNNNEATIAFYKKMNYDVLYEFIAYPKRRMYRFIKKI